MRVWDLLTVVLLGTYLVCTIRQGFPARTTLRRLLLGTTVLTVAAHLALEHYRWQMIPAYATFTACGLAVMGSWFRAGKTPVCTRKTVRILLPIAGFTALLLTVASSWLFPLFVLPQPGGPFAIGTMELYFRDTTRPEIHTANPFDSRELMVRVWYPAAKGQGKPAPYWLHTGQIVRAINHNNGPSGLLFSHLDRVPSHSFINAPLSGAQATYPIVIFSHGLGMGYSAQNTVLAEELASRGYVIFSIDHSYDGLAAIFPDGRFTWFMEEGYESHDPEPPADLLALAKSVMNGTDPVQMRQVLKRVIREQPDGARIDSFWSHEWSKDQRFVIDQVALIQAGNLAKPLSGHLDLSKIAVMGMSFGGSASINTCAMDPRCKAGLNLDGFQPVLVEVPPQRVPFMYFCNGEVSLNRVLFTHDESYRYLVQVKHSGHLDFTDMPLITPLVKLTGAAGTIDTQRMLSITNAYVVSFLDRHLLGKPAPLLTHSPSDYPEVLFTALSPSNGENGAGRSLQ